ncbi:MAG: sigma-70 family RNA polymerase sigma factor [Planctomycetes bacterium]|nr:sigma-70 family RNA polymerase sigma factor [Planctomycetota bacterium]
MNTTPISLLERLRQPNPEEAWARFVELYTPLIYRWARRIGLQHADAADLVQDVFTVLVQKMPTFEYDKSKSFRSWLRTVTFNTWRERHRRKTLPMAGTDGPSVSDVASPEDPEGFWEEEYRQQLIGRAIGLMQAEFQPTTWKAFWEYVARGRPPAEVAAELGISRRAVYIAKSRVLRRLRQELAGLMD